MGNALRQSRAGGSGGRHAAETCDRPYLERADTRPRSVSEYGEARPAGDRASQVCSEPAEFDVHIPTSGVAGEAVVVDAQEQDARGGVGDQSRSPDFERRPVADAGYQGPAREVR